MLLFTESPTHIATPYFSTQGQWKQQRLHYVLQAIYNEVIPLKAHVTSQSRGPSPPAN